MLHHVIYRQRRNGCSDQGSLHRSFLSRSRPVCHPFLPSYNRCRSRYHISAMFVNLGSSKMRTTQTTKNYNCSTPLHDFLPILCPIYIVFRVEWKRAFSRTFRFSLLILPFLLFRVVCTENVSRDNVYDIQVLFLSGACGAAWGAR